MCATPFFSLSSFFVLRFNVRRFNEFSTYELCHRSCVHCLCYLLFYFFHLFNLPIVETARRKINLMHFQNKCLFTRAKNVHISRRRLSVTLRNWNIRQYGKKKSRPNGKEWRHDNMDQSPKSTMFMRIRMCNVSKEINCMVCVCVCTGPKLVINRKMQRTLAISTNKFAIIFGASINFHPNFKRLTIATERANRQKQMGFIYVPAECCEFVCALAIWLIYLEGKSMCLYPIRSAFI